MPFIIISQILVFTSKFTAFLSPVKTKNKPGASYLLLFPFLMKSISSSCFSANFCLIHIFALLALKLAQNLSVFNCECTKLLSLPLLFFFFMLWHKYFAFFPNTFNFFTDSRMYRGFLLPPEDVWNLRTIYVGKESNVLFLLYTFYLFSICPPSASLSLIYTLYTGIALWSSENPKENIFLLYLCAL